jgi:hypothetical protein
MDERTLLRDHLRVSESRPRRDGISQQHFDEAVSGLLSLAFSNRCDVIIDAVFASAELVAQERAVLEFLDSDLLHWDEAIVGV